jgi:hypothetical protein
VAPRDVLRGYVGLAYREAKAKYLHSAHANFKQYLIDTLRGSRRAGNRYNPPGGPIGELNRQKDGVLAHLCANTTNNVWYVFWRIRAKQLLGTRRAASLRPPSRMRWRSGRVRRWR